ncbi:hypothetical protein H0H87_002347 [Tephrocybe sp. NHM501043]|nr:hypothetical protein H0H87_002347 [Tephrocybe sp. NHM501043]
MSSSSAPNVQYRQLGKSGLRVSVPIVGAMSFGSSKWADWVIEEEPTFKVLQAAWDLGINTIDTANVYSNGESERIIGKWIKQVMSNNVIPTWPRFLTSLSQSNIPRERLIIATKCWGLVANDPSLRTSLIPGLADQRDYVNQSGLSRAAIFNAVDASLSRLGVSYIDLLQIHRFDPRTPVEETMKALHDLIESGKVRYIGASSMRTWQFALMNEVAEKRGWTKFVSMQSEYSLLYREEEREMHAYCKYHGIGLIPWAPLAAGLLTRPSNVSSLRNDVTTGTPLERPLSAADRDIIARVEELASKKNIQMAQVALAWAAAKVSSPIIGVNSVERLTQGITTGVTLTEEEMKYLEEPYQPKPVRGHA